MKNIPANFLGQKVDISTKFSKLRNVLITQITSSSVIYKTETGEVGIVSNSFIYAVDMLGDDKHD